MLYFSYNIPLETSYTSMNSHAMHIKIIIMKEKPSPMKKQENSNSLPKIVQSNADSFPKFAKQIKYFFEIK